MNVTELLKQAVAESPHLAETLKPENGSAGYVDFRGTRYTGIFRTVYVHEEVATGVLEMTDYSQACPFSDWKIPVNGSVGAKIEFDPETGMFVGMLDDKTPCTGDAAYTSYRGLEYVGVLRMRGDGKFGYIEPVKKDENWGYHQPEITRGLSVGYDERIVWSEDEGMYYAPADHD